MKAPVDITYLADTVIRLRYFEAQRQTGRFQHQETDWQSRIQDPKILDAARPVTSRLAKRLMPEVDVKLKAGYGH